MKRARGRHCGASVAELSQGLCNGMQGLNRSVVKAKDIAHVVIDVLLALAAFPRGSSKTLLMPWLSLVFLHRIPRIYL